MKNLLLCFQKIFSNLFSKERHDSYKIIPLGTYCLPRVITTLCKLKPRKKQGEKTCPFDLGFFMDLDANINLLKTHFEGFYDDACLAPAGCWENKKLSIIFNHETTPDKNIFKEIYDRRIKNLYDYISDDSLFIHILIASLNPVKEIQINNLIETMKELKPNLKFDIIVVNQSKEKLQCESEFVHIIDYTEDTLFEKINKNGGWASRLKHRKSIAAIKFYNKITKDLKSLIKPE